MGIAFEEEEDNGVTDTTPVTEAPCTLIGWAQFDELTLFDRCPLSLCNSNSLTNYFVIYVERTMRQFVLRAQGGSNDVAQSTVAAIIGRWHHIAARFQNAASALPHALFIDGILEAEVASDAIPLNLDVIGLGVQATNPRQRFMSGCIHWPGIYRIALEDNQISSLASGVNPLLIEGDNLPFFVENEADVVGGLNLNLNVNSQACGRPPLSRLRRYKKKTYRT